MTKVFGIDKRGRVRGVGNIVSRSQIISSLPALEKLAMKDKEVTKQSSMGKNLQTQVDCIRVEQKGLMEEFKGLKQLIEVLMLLWIFFLIYIRFHNIRFFSTFT